MTAKSWERKSDKAAALPHVLYEIAMLLNSYGALTHPIEEPTLAHSQAVTNAWVESFAIHARNLNEFFGGKVASNYMLPGHFIPEWKRTYVFDGPLQGRASAEITHLTYSRERQEEKTQWDIPGIFERFRTPMLEFLTIIHEDEKLMWYGQNLLQTHELLRNLAEIPFAPSVSAKTPIPPTPAGKHDPMGPRANATIRVGGIGHRKRDSKTPT